MWGWAMGGVQTGHGLSVNVSISSNWLSHLQSCDYRRRRTENLATTTYYNKEVGSNSLYENFIRRDSHISLCMTALEITFWIARICQEFGSTPPFLQILIISSVRHIEYISNSALYGSYLLMHL